MKGACGNCRFWEKTMESQDGQEDRLSGEMIGNCHRFPPALHGGWERIPAGGDIPTGGPEADWAYWCHPLTTESDWCGEHQPLPEAIPRALIPEEYRDD